MEEDRPGVLCFGGILSQKCKPEIPNESILSIDELLFVWYMHQLNQKIKSTITNSGPPDVMPFGKNNINYIVFLQINAWI